MWQGPLAASPSVAAGMSGRALRCGPQRWAAHRPGLPGLTFCEASPAECVFYSVQLHAGPDCSRCSQFLRCTMHFCCAIVYTGVVPAGHSSYVQRHPRQHGERADGGRPESVCSSVQRTSRPHPCRCGGLCMAHSGCSARTCRLERMSFLLHCHTLEHLQEASL